MLLLPELEILRDQPCKSGSDPLGERLGPVLVLVVHVGDALDGVGGRDRAEEVEAAVLDHLGVQLRMVPGIKTTQ